MTYIKTISEEIAGIEFSYPMAERYKQKLSALRTMENRFYNGLKQQKEEEIYDEDTKLIRFRVRDYMIVLGSCLLIK